MLRVVPVTLEVANRFIDAAHRHNDPLPGAKLVVGVEKRTRLLDGPEWVLCGVGVAGNPSAPALQKVPGLIEIRRVCTDGTRNACSMIYGALRNAAKALGYEVAITYTLPSEGGASLKAAGFVLDKQDAGGPAKAWHNRPGRKVLPIEDDLVGGKWRWVTQLREGWKPGRGETRSGSMAKPRQPGPKDAPNTKHPAENTNV